MGILDFGAPAPTKASTTEQGAEESRVRTDIEPLMEFTTNLSIPYSQWRALVIDIKSRGEEPPLIADQLIPLEELRLWPEKL